MAVKRTKRVARGKKRFSRRRFKKSGGFKRPSFAIQKTPGEIMPDRFFCKMGYQDHGRFTNAVGTIDSDAYSGNGIWDANLQIGGLQPPGFDQFSLFYDNYRVYASKCFIEFVNGSNVTTPQVAVVPANILTLPAYLTVDEIFGNNLAKTAIMSIAGGSKDRLVIKSFMSTSKMIGISLVKAEENAAGGSGAGGSNPNLSWQWLIYCYSLGGTLNLEYIVQLTYYVEWFNRKLLVDV